MCHCIFHCNVILPPFRWCPPCKKISPVAEKFCESKKVTLLKIDIDQAGPLATAYEITNVPTFILIHKSPNNIV